MECSRKSLLVFFLICADVVSCRSGESIHEVLRELARRGDHDHVMSPSPSPLPATQPESLSCDDVSNKCYIKNCSVTACVPFVGNGSFIVVVNGGESSVELNIVVYPANIALDGLVIYGHQVNKIMLISSNMSGISSIDLVRVGNNGDDECTIHLINPQGVYINMTSINATYVFFVAALFMGGSLACCKVVKMRRQNQVIPYQELQMEHQLSDSTSGTGTRWDQSWDGEWDDEENTIKVSENGGSFKYAD